jgi:hypothetical protein
MVRTFLIAAATALLVPAAARAQEVASQPAPYCADLKRVTFLAVTRDRFASIAGKPREGEFRDTSLPLTGWKDCALYGPATYTCDSQDLKSAKDAETAQASMAREIIGCLGSHWAELKDRSSPAYLVLHPASGPLSITLSLDQTDKGQYTVRFTLFLRR